MRVIHAPAGKCPFKLNGTKENEVLEWAESVLGHGQQNDVMYTTGALNYYAQQFYNIFSDEYKIVSGIINDHYVRDDYVTYIRGKTFEASQGYFKNPHF